MCQCFHTYGARYEGRNYEKKGLVLPCRMKAQINGGVYMLAIIGSLKLMGCLKRNRVKRKRVMLTVKLMSKHLAIKSPAKSRRQHADEQGKYDRSDETLIHAIRLYT